MWKQKKISKKVFLGDKYMFQVNNVKSGQVLISWFLIISF